MLNTSIHARSERVAIFVIFIIAIILRFYGLPDQGLRTSDGGHYAHQAWKVLMGQENGIKDKPGHTLMIVISFMLFGLKMSSPLFMSAGSGLVFILFTWLLVRRRFGRVAGLFTAALAAVTPFFLFYHRGANADANLLTFLMGGMLLYDRVLDTSPTDTKRYFGWAIGSGMTFGFCLSVNYSMATTFVPVCLAFVIHSFRQHREHWKRILMCILAVLVSFAIGYAIPCVLLWPYIEHKELFRQVIFHQQGFRESAFSFRFLLIPMQYAGAPFVLLGAIGIWRMADSRRPFEVFVLIQFGLMILGYCRSALPYPRVYLPLCLPLLFGCAAAIQFIWVSLKDSSQRRVLVVAGSLLLCIGVQAREIYGAVTLHSGYEEAMSRLLEDGDDFKAGGTTHTWWVFEAFTGRRFGFASDLLASKFAAPDWHERAPASFRSLRRQGFSHIVLDYMLWNRLKIEHNQRFEQFLKLYPPTYRIPNPAAGHQQTVAEDGGLPEAGTNPLSEFIYIWRLGEFP
ncbi:MAG: glycosyltransferase family 39 protein [Planctomycetota bacterium]|nr:glycosyltransferase family 39 protein [Planctomycetota bacterium]MDA1139224.1 glycosyltransferase family 39 protein [Planctomycetota bacterium]